MLGDRKLMLPSGAVLSHGLRASSGVDHRLSRRAGSGSRRSKRRLEARSTNARGSAGTGLVFAAARVSAAQCAEPLASARAEHVVPVAAFERRPKALKCDCELFGERMMPLREPVPCPIRVRGAAEKSAGEHCDPSERRLERRDSAWAHATARRARACLRVSFRRRRRSPSPS